jgi:hypothetical protein
MTTTLDQKLESYRELFKKQTKQSDRQFDKLVKSYQNPQHALSYLRGRLGCR